MKTNAARRIEHDESEGPKSGLRRKTDRFERKVWREKRKASWQSSRGMFDATIVGERIRELRLARKLSLVMMHERGAPTPSMLGRIEHGLANPSLDTIHDIARALNVRPFALFIGKDRMSWFFLEIHDDAAFDRLRLAIERIGY